MSNITNFIWIESKGYWMVKGRNYESEFGSACGHWVSFDDVVWC